MEISILWHLIKLVEFFLGEEVELLIIKDNVGMDISKTQKHQSKFKTFQM